MLGNFYLSIVFLKNLCVKIAAPDLQMDFHDYSKRFNDLFINAPWVEPLLGCIYIE